MVSGTTAHVPIAVPDKSEHSFLVSGNANSFCCSDRGAIVVTCCDTERSIRLERLAVVRAVNIKCLANASRSTHQVARVINLTSRHHFTYAPNRFYCTNQDRAARTGFLCDNVEAAVCVDRVNIKGASGLKHRSIGVCDPAVAVASEIIFT